MLYARGMPKKQLNRQRFRSQYVHGMMIKHLHQHQKIRLGKLIVIFLFLIYHFLVEFGTIEITKFVCRRPSQNSCVDSRCSSPDISEISERIKKSCGIRQNTVDSDMFSSQRLAPTIQPRRASITTTPAR